MARLYFDVAVVVSQLGHSCDSTEVLLGLRWYYCNREILLTFLVLCCDSTVILLCLLPCCSFLPSLALHCDKDAVVVVQQFLLHSFENMSARERLAGRDEDELPLHELEVITPLSGKL